MPPPSRLSRGAGPKPQQPQHQQMPSGSMPLGHLHHFHQHQHQQPPPPPPQQGGGGGYGGNSSSAPAYGGGNNVGGSPDRGQYGNQQQPYTPLQHQNQQQQPQGGWGHGGNNGYATGPTSNNNSMYGGQHGNPPPPQLQQSYGGNEMEYGGSSMHGSPYPQQQQPQQGGGSANSRQQSQLRRGQGPSYYNQGPPPPPPQQQQQVGNYRGGPQGGHVPHMEPSPSFAGGYVDGTLGSPPPSPGYHNNSGGGGGNATRGGISNSSNNNNNHSINPANYGGYPPHDGMLPPPPPNGGAGGMGASYNGAGPMHSSPLQQQQQQGMYGGGGGGMLPPNAVPPQQQWGGPQGGYSSAPPPHQHHQQPGIGPMSGVPGMMPDGGYQQMPPPPSPQQGRDRGNGVRGGRGGSVPHHHQQHPPPQQQQHQQMVGPARHSPGPQHHPPQQPMMGPGAPPPPPLHMHRHHQHQQQSQAPPMMNGAIPMPQLQMYGSGPIGGGGGGMPGMAPMDQGSIRMPQQPQRPPPIMLMPPVDFVTEECAEQSNDVGYFYDFLKGRRLLKEDDLANFMPPDYNPKRDGPVKVAVDGNYMINNLRGVMQRADPLWFLHSVLPGMLLEVINAEVTKMRERNLEPVWVFQGIGSSGDVEAFLPSKDELLARDEVWRKLTTGELPAPEAVTEAFDASSSIGTDVLMAVQRFLRSELNVMAVTAPFLNWCQMATFHKEGDVYQMVGPPEMLMVPYEPMKVIVEIDLDRGRVAYFDRDEVIRTLFPDYVEGNDTHAAGDRLLDFGLLVATHSTLSTSRAQLRLSSEQIFQELASPQPAFPTLKDFIAKNMFGDLNAPGDVRHGAQALRHSKGRTYVTCSPVFTKNGADSPLVYFKRVLDPKLANRNMANNLSGVFGNFVPLSLLYFQFCGLLSVDMMTIVAQSYFRDEMPVSDSCDYQDLLSRLVIMRSQTLCQIVPHLNGNHRRRLERISWVRWFNNVLTVVPAPGRSIVLDEWDLHNTPEARAVMDTDLDNITIDTVLALQSRVRCVPRGAKTDPTLPGHDKPVWYYGKKEIFFAVLLKTFDFLGYISHNAPEDMLEDGEHQIEKGSTTLVDAETGRHVPLSGDANLNGSNSDGLTNAPEVRGEGEDGNATNISTALLIDALRHCPPEMHSGMIRLAEMARIALLNARPCTYIVAQLGSDKSMYRVDTEDGAEVLLATRIACLISIPYLDSRYPDGGANAEPPVFEWAPVYSRHLCTFSIIVRAMNRHLRELVEVVATAVFVSGHSSASLDDFASLATFLPFGDMPSAIGGLLLHYVLVFPADYENDCNTPQERCAYLQSKFRNIQNVAEQLRAVMTFVFNGLYFLNAYRMNSDEENKLAPELQQIGSTEYSMDIIDEALKLMHEKWTQHLDGPAPADIHGGWPLSV